MRTGTSEPRERASWTLAASVHQADIDYGARSSRRGYLHAYPPFGTVPGHSLRMFATTYIDHYASPGAR
jgi:hypothetical protein